MKHEIIDQIKTELGELARHLGMDQASSEGLANDAMSRILFVIGGQKIEYLPRVDRKTRNEGIIKDFNGKNHRLIAKKYGVSLATVYRILSKRQL